jgi:beta-mannanase
MTALRTLWPLGLVAGFLAGLPFWSPQRNVAFLTGAYRYPSVADSLPNSTIETAFVSWVDPTAPAQIDHLLDRAKRRRSLAMLSLEPFADPARPNGHRTLVDDVINGAYQQRLTVVLKALCRPDQPVLLRFGHEMDNTNQYPWSVRRGSDYVRLYRAVWAQAQQPRCRRIHWVWSPAGNGDSSVFWPGGDVVDLIGVSVYSSPRWSRNGELHSFAQVYERRRWLHLQFRKPLLVAEMGVTGTDQQRRRWLIEAREAIRWYPELIGWVYFSAPQPTWIPLVTGHEDWSLSSELLDLVTHPQPSYSFHCQLLHVSLPVLHQKICHPRQPGSA